VLLLDRHAEVHDGREVFEGGGGVGDGAHGGIIGGGAAETRNAKHETRNFSRAGGEWCLLYTVPLSLIGGSADRRYFGPLF
jgi:hypothetical protein